MEAPNILDFPNVNGVGLSLQMHPNFDSSLSANSSPPESRKFIISYKSETITDSRRKMLLAIGFIFNLMILFYVHIYISVFIYIFIITAFLVYLWLTHTVQTETLLVIPTVGIQSSVKYVWGKEDIFISWNSIDDVIINEVIQMNRVLFVLTVLVKPNTEMNSENQVKLVPMFEYTKPRLVMIKMIYSELQVLMREIVRARLEGSGDNG